MSAARNRGFTLPEILVATTISGFIAMVAVGAMKAVSDSAHRVNQASETAAEVRFAARMLAHDLTNLYRDPNPENMKLVGASQGSETGGPVYLTFYTVNRAKARADQPEGDVYEVEYILGRPADEEEAPAPAMDGIEKMVLFRRLWPNPDKDRSPGGILTPIAENINVFQVRFFDGQQWGSEWPEEMRSLPELVEVTLAIQPQEKGQLFVESFTVSFPRMVQTTGAAGEQGETPANEQGQGQSSSPPANESTGGQGAPANAGGPQDSGNRRR